VENGIDVNAEINSRSQFRTTPLCAAARYADLELCKYLVAHGADVTIAEKSGMRPYNIAIERGEFPMADFFKSLESPDFHNAQNKLAELRSYKLPESLVDFLQGDNLRFDFNESDVVRDCKFIEFLPLTDTMQMKAGRQKLLQISRKVDNFSIVIAWNPKTKMIAFYDEEHSELDDIAPFEDFINNLASYIQKVLTGNL
jgi:ankyrin repeat protein